MLSINSDTPASYLASAACRQTRESRAPCSRSGSRPQRDAWPNVTFAPPRLKPLIRETSSWWSTTPARIAQAGAGFFPGQQECRKLRERSSTESAATSMKAANLDSLFLDAAYCPSLPAVASLKQRSTRQSRLERLS